MADIIIGSLVLLAVVLAILKIRKDRKNGSCCSGCSGCSGHNPSASCNAFDTFEEEARESLKKNNK